MRRYFSVGIAGAAFCLLAACNGTVMMTPLPADQIDQQPSPAQYDLDPANKILDKGYPGPIVYLSRPAIELDKYTQIQELGSDKKTLVLTNVCDWRDANFIKIAQVADRNHPFLLHYNAATFETVTFAATLNPDGTLASINTASTPDQGKTLSSVATTLSTLGALAATMAAVRNPSPSPSTHDKSAPPPESRPCTQTPVFERYLGWAPVVPDHTASITDILAPSGPVDTAMTESEVESVLAQGRSVHLLTANGSVQHLRHGMNTFEPVDFSAIHTAADADGKVVGKLTTTGSGTGLPPGTYYLYVEHTGVTPEGFFVGANGRAIAASKVSISGQMKPDEPTSSMAVDWHVCAYDHWICFYP